MAIQPMQEFSLHVIIFQKAIHHSLVDDNFHPIYWCWTQVMDFCSDIALQRNSEKCFIFFKFWFSSLKTSYLDNPEK